MGYIYFIHQEGTDLWKVGRTKKPIDRIKKHKNSNVNTKGYTMLFEVNDDVLAETFLMRKWKDYRHDEREFFELPLSELKNVEAKLIGLKKSYYSYDYYKLIQGEDNIASP
jgi:hypothetical protein